METNMAATLGGLLATLRPFEQVTLGRSGDNYFIKVTGTDGIQELIFKSEFSPFTDPSSTENLLAEEISRLRMLVEQTDKTWRDSGKKPREPVDTLEDGFKHFET